MKIQEVADPPPPPPPPHIHEVGRARACALGISSEIKHFLSKKYFWGGQFLTIGDINELYPTNKNSLATPLMYTDHKMCRGCLLYSVNHSTHPLHILMAISSLHLLR